MAIGSSIFLLIICLLLFLVSWFYKKTSNSKTVNNNDIQLLRHRFRDAVLFLKKTTIKRNSKSKTLRTLPWYLLIGPEGAGKTALLTHAEVNYILQKNKSNQEETVTTGEHCDWWVTTDVTILDVPSRYSKMQQANEQTITDNQLLQQLLQLIKQETGKQTLQGILLALPLPELLMANEKTKTSAFQYVFQFLNEIQKMFNKRIPVILIITKCDLLPGFKTFFSETLLEETSQAWGITLPHTNQRHLPDAIMTLFNPLLKRLNQRLLWRLHHERNPTLRPLIKDFPLQMERLKECIVEFAQKYLSLQTQFPVQGIYLTSALQTEVASQQVILATQNETRLTASRDIQLFNPPANQSRSYFINQLLLQGLKTPTLTKTLPTSWSFRFKKIAIYTCSLLLISISTYYLTKDFNIGLARTYDIADVVSQYQHSINTTHNTEQQLLYANDLLSKLDAEMKGTYLKFKISHILNFYTHKSEITTKLAYAKAAQTIFLPVLKDFIGDNLTLPLNQQPATIYGLLKTYLMFNNTSQIDKKSLIHTLSKLPLKLFNKQNKTKLAEHLRFVLQRPFIPLKLDKKLIDEARQYLTSLPTTQLALTILENSSANMDAIVLNALKQKNIFVQQNTNYTIADIYTKKHFFTILQTIPNDVKQAILGNDIIGFNQNALLDGEIETKIQQSVRELYIQNYVTQWENVLSQTQLVKVDDLQAIDNLIMHITNKDSEFLKLLQLIHVNTYFEPIITASSRLQNLGLLIEHSREKDNLLYQIFAGLKSLHFYLQNALITSNSKKAAFFLVTARMQNSNDTDAITKLRMIADKSPEPVNTWLMQITDVTWSLLIKNASQYIDTSWRKVIQTYKHDIANRYPFNKKAKAEVNVKDFVNFFGHPGLMTNYFGQYLQPLVDTSGEIWHWKIRDNRQVFLSQEKLRQIQYAIKIHRTFFPNNDNKLNLQFALLPYEFSKDLQSIKIKLGDQEITNSKQNLKMAQNFSWPNSVPDYAASLQLKTKVLTDKHFAGHWGLFKLINQYFESIITKQQMVLNFTANKESAKYLLITDGQTNPFLAFNLHYFKLPEHLQ